MNVVFSVVLALSLALTGAFLTTGDVVGDDLEPIGLEMIVDDPCPF